MKKALLPVLFATILSSSAALAADEKVGDSCPLPGATTDFFPSGLVLSCVDGKWEVNGYIGTQRLNLEVQLMEGSKSLWDAHLHPLNGEPTPLSFTSERSYIAEVQKKEPQKAVLVPRTVELGFSMVAIPKLANDGKITVEIRATESDVASMNKLKVGEMEVEVPVVGNLNLNQTLTLDNGKEIAISFGPKYTLKIIATRG